jgi:putative FmdB family regulatory protein
MPIYEYKCRDCGSHFEKRQSVSDEPLKVCESCGGTLEKQWSRSGFQFKGEGWYVTDYSSKKSSDGGEKSAPSESTAKSEAASNTKSDTATKADTGSSKD